MQRCTASAHARPDDGRSRALPLRLHIAISRLPRRILSAHPETFSVPQAILAVAWTSSDGHIMPNSIAPRRHGDRDVDGKGFSASVRNVVRSTTCHCLIHSSLVHRSTTRDHADARASVWRPYISPVRQEGPRETRLLFPFHSFDTSLTGPTLDRPVPPVPLLAFASHCFRSRASSSCLSFVKPWRCQCPFPSRRLIPPLRSPRLTRSSPQAPRRTTAPCARPQMATERVCRTRRWR